MELEEEKVKLRKYIITGIIILLVFIFLLAILKTFKNSKYSAKSYIKQVATYTIKGTNVSSKLPRLLIDSNSAKSVNQEIEDDYNKAIASVNQAFNYQYSINDKYFSLVTYTYLTEEKTGYTYPKFKTYNFSLDTKELVDDDTLLNKFNKTWQDVSNTLETKMQQNYQGEIDELYLSEQECDFACFLNRRQIEDFDTDNHLYVLNNKLYFYHGFMIFSNLGEERFYKNETFLYEVEEG